MRASYPDAFGRLTCFSSSVSFLMRRSPDSTPFGFQSDGWPRIELRPSTSHILCAPTRLNVVILQTPSLLPTIAAPVLQHCPRTFRSHNVARASGPSPSPATTRHRRNAAPTSR